MVGTTKAHSVRSAAIRGRHGVDHEREEEEQDRSIAVPDRGLEAPQVADQQGRDEDRDEGIAEDCRQPGRGAW